MKSKKDNNLLETFLCYFLNFRKTITFGRNLQLLFIFSELPVKYPRSSISAMNNKMDCISKETYHIYFIGMKLKHWIVIILNIKCSHHSLKDRINTCVRTYNKQWFHCKYIRFLEYLFWHDFIIFFKKVFFLHFFIVIIFWTIHEAKKNIFLWILWG